MDEEHWPATAHAPDADVEAVHRQGTVYRWHPIGFSCEVLAKAISLELCPSRRTPSKRRGCLGRPIRVHTVDMVASSQGRQSSRADDVRVVIRRVISEARDDRITTTAQALAYSVFLAIPAVFLVVLGVFSLAATPNDVASVIDRMRGVIPPEAATLLSDSLNRSANSPGSGLVMTIVGLVLAVWTITSAATTLMQGITTAFDRKDNRGFVRKRLLALVIVMCLVAAATLVGGFLVFGPYVEGWLGDATAQPGLVSWLWWTAQWPVLIVALLSAFAVLLYLGPDVEQPSWKWVTPGAVVALIIWVAASGGFSIYASQFGSYQKTWGTLSAVVVLLIWLWLTNLALLLGAEVNAEIEQLAIEHAQAEGFVPAIQADRARPPTGPRG